MAKIIEKFHTGYQVQTNDSITITHSVIGAVEVKTTDTGSALVANNWVPTLQVMAEAYEDAINASGLNAGGRTWTVDVDSNGYFSISITAGTGTITTVIAKTAGAAGGAFSLWLGADDYTEYVNGTTAGDEWTGLTSTTASATNLSSGVYYPDDSILQDEALITQIKSTATEADSGSVVFTYLGYDVEKKEISLFIPHSEAFENDTNGFNNFQTQWRDWAHGKLFAIHKNRADNAMFGRVSNTDGYRVYRLDPETDFNYRPSRTVPGMDLFWAWSFKCVECGDADFMDETEV